MHVITFPLLIILTGIIIDWIRFRPERVAAVTPATSRWRPRALSACSDTLNAKEQSFSMSPIHLTPSQNRDGACGKSLIRMMENKNHLNTKSNNDNKDKVPRKRHFGNRACVCAVASANSDSLWPHGLQPTRLLCPWDSPGKNTGVGCHSLLQEIFTTQESNQCLLSLL